LRLRTKKIAIITLFGAGIFLTKTVVPSPMNKMLVFVQALLLGLGTLLLQKLGATSVAVIGGVLTALWNTALAPFSFFFALLYGLFVDGSFHLLRVNTLDGNARTKRSIAAMTLSTVLVGLLSYYTSVLFGLIPRNLALEVIIFSMGILGGITAGYFISSIWNKRLASYLKQLQLDY
jgi:hypothetical protein